MRPQVPLKIRRLAQGQDQVEVKVSLRIFKRTLSDSIYTTDMSILMNSITSSRSIVPKLK